MKHYMEGKVLQFIKQYKMISQGDNITVGLSGGADSVCLTLMLMNLREKLDITVSAVHVNHHIRTVECYRDENFCREFCEKFNLPFEVENIDVAAFCEKNNCGTEEGARILRYEIFGKHKVTATAHSASDNLETSLFNYMRGSGLTGISGIPPVRYDEKTKIIRPLLVLTRKEIEQYVHEQYLKFFGENYSGEEYVTDSTNLSDDYSRNKIRHNLIPLMKHWNPTIEDTSAENLEALRTDLDFIESQADAEYSKHYNSGKLIGIKNLPPAIRQRCIIKFLKKNNFSYNFKRVREIDSMLEYKTCGKLNISRDKFIIYTDDEISVETIIKKDTELLATELVEGENSIFPDYAVCVICVKDENCVKELKLNNLVTFFYLDCDKIKGVPVLRNRRFGDKIKPCGKDFHISVKKWIQSNVPKEERQYMHFIEDNEGLIFVEHIGVAQRVAADDKTKRFLVLSVMRKNK